MEGEMLFKMFVELFCILLFNYTKIKLLVVFSTSYLYEKSFSSLTLIKTKQRNRLDAEAFLRVLETSFMPRLDSMAAKQQQISH